MTVDSTEPSRTQVQRSVRLCRCKHSGSHTLSVGRAGRAVGSGRLVGPPDRVGRPCRRVVHTGRADLPTPAGTGARAAGSRSAGANAECDAARSNASSANATTERRAERRRGGAAVARPMTPVTPLVDPSFPRNFGRLVLGCVDTSDRESRRIFQHVSRSTRFGFFFTAPNLEM